MNNLPVESESAKPEERRHHDRYKPWRFETLIVSAVTFFILTGVIFWVNVALVVHDRDQCLRDGVRAEVLYDFIGDAQNGRRREIKTAEESRRDVGEVLSGLGIPKDQLQDSIDLFIAPDTEQNNRMLVENYSELRGRLRQAVEDDFVLPGHQVRVDCSKEFNFPAPVSWFRD